jgi:hypothetical protein
VKTKENESEMPESIDPTGFWRFIFWLVYVIGTLVLLFSWLLSMVPGEVLTGDIIVRSCAAGLMLASILMARWLWKIRNPIPDQGSATVMQVVLLIAWAELGFAIFGIIGMATFRLFRR